MNDTRTTAIDLSNDYCGCCGGLSVNPPKGEHGPCCADQHDTGNDLADGLSNEDLDHIITDAYQRSGQLNDQLRHTPYPSPAYDRLREQADLASREFRAAAKIRRQRGFGA